MKRNIASMLIILLLLGIAGTAFAASQAGSSGDPLISLSYITSKLIPDVKKQASDRADAAYASKYNAAVERLESAAAQTMAKSLPDSFINDIINRTSESDTYSGSFSPKTFNNGDIVTGALGTSFFLRSGGASVSGGTLVNITEGTEVADGTSLKLNNRYMVVTETYPGIRITSDNTTVGISGSYALPAAYSPLYTDLADALKAMALFRGSDSGYSLNRAANRLEALVMLIRLIGEENSALSCTDSHPFKDVPEWGKPYVAYAYKMGYTNGVSADRFGTESAILPTQYMTYILRALGYSDAAGDFSWDKAIEKSLGIGLITEGERVMLENVMFYRDHVVYVSYFALYCNLKDGTQTLLDRLISTGVLTQASADAAFANVKTSRIK